MKKYLFFFFIIITANTMNGYAQYSRYIIQLKDKSGTPYSINNPSQFLTQRSIARRQRYAIPVDSTDLPITPAYIDSISAAGNVTILNVSKWLNQVCIRTIDTAALSKINSFSFVIGVPPIAARPAGNNQPANPINNKWQDSTINLPSPKMIAARPAGTENYYDYGVAYPQIHLNEGEFLHNHGFRGQGMQMAITDEGFDNYTILTTFDSVRNNNQILGTWNYVSGDTDVDEGIGHGLDCFSTIAANLPGTFVGTAPQTSFYLYVTEDVNSEYPVEEQNWAAATEKADSLGVDVVSVSLGYNTFDSSIFNYTYADMNGHTTIDARIANFASNKGMLIVAAAGNEGETAWHYIDTPGDADSALTLGAVDTGGVVAPFSSYGPNSSGQTKPDVAAVGWNAVLANDATGLPYYGSGTSFATPIMAGLATCLWQAFPEVNNMSIIDALHKASNQANNPDDQVGYGIPDMKKAFVGLIEKLHTQQVAVTNCNAVINWTAKSATDMNFIIERKLPSDTAYQPIDTQSANTNFVTNNFTFSDNLSLLPIGINNIQYKIEMNIATDTSFYLDSAIITPPTLTATIINAFGNICIGNISAANSFILSGINLPANNISIGPLNNYSFDTIPNGNYSSTLSLTQPGGIYNQTIYIKFMPDSIGNFNDNIPVNYYCNSITIPVSGTGVNTTLATAATDSATVLSTHNALLNGSIISVGCNPVSNYGFEYSTYINFTNGTGAAINSGNISSGNFTASLSGLTQNTTYYYKAFVTSNDSTIYGDEQSFTTAPIPNELIIYPSPAPHSGTIYYSVNGTMPGQYEVHIYNSIGQLVFNREISSSVNFVDDSFILPAYLSTGLYSLQIVNAHFNAKRSFLIH
jgi:serine protease AprX